MSPRRVVSLVPSITESLFLLGAGDRVVGWSRDSTAVFVQRGFEVPVARWLAGPLRPMLQDTLLARDARVRSFVDPSALAAFAAGTDDFPGNRPQSLWALLMLELFLRGTDAA